MTHDRKTTIATDLIAEPAPLSKDEARMVADAIASIDAGKFIDEATMDAWFETILATEANPASTAR